MATGGTCRNSMKKNSNFNNVNNAGCKKTRGCNNRSSDRYTTNNNKTCDNHNNCTSHCTNNHNHNHKHNHNNLISRSATGRTS